MRKRKKVIRMIAVLKKPLMVYMFDDPEWQAPITIEPGRYELEEIPNPLDKNGRPWWVIKGTSSGAVASYWQRYVRLVG
ncbi:MAG: hypothetical protein Q7S15_00450 [bacterium]|nr:hypothetical protein [bacterium]